MSRPSGQEGLAGPGREVSGLCRVRQTQVWVLPLPCHPVLSEFGSNDPKASHVGVSI
jgi:hypothetical protein